MKGHDVLNLPTASWGRRSPSIGWSESARLVHAGGRRMLHDAALAGLHKRLLDSSICLDRSALLLDRARVLLSRRWLRRSRPGLALKSTRPASSDTSS